MLSGNFTLDISLRTKILEVVNFYNGWLLRQVWRGRGRCLVVLVVEWVVASRCGSDAKAVVCEVRAYCEE